MADSDFQPDKRTIEDLYVGAEYYLIPRFQRPYSWDADNLDSFWRDVVHDNPIGYFIGPMVAWTEQDSPIRRLVDGQQRLTTIAIMFAVIREQFVRLGETDLADGVQRYLEKRDRDNVLRFTLETEAASNFLPQAILRNPPDTDSVPVSEEEEALSKALEAIRRRVAQEVNKYDTPTAWLKEFRDRLLGLRVIWIEHGNEDDAYVIYETLNSRGKDLEVVDLLKNLLLSRLKGTGNPDSDVDRAKWDRVRNELEATDSRRRLDPNRFILHWWLSQQEYVAERKLFVHIKKQVPTRSIARERLDSLTKDARLYRAVQEPESWNWPIEEDDARRSLEALEIFGITQPTPLLLSLMRARQAGPKLSASQFRSTLQVIERFHFQYTIVSQLRSSGGVSEMYAKAARELFAAGTDQQNRANVLKDIRTKLIARQPDEEQFVLAFADRFVFTNSNTRDSKLVRYVLRTLLRSIFPTTDPTNLSIEHIMPQSKIEQEGASVVGSLGNLVLVNEEINSKLGNKGFADKKKILAADAEGIYDVGDVLRESTWGATEIAERTERLARRAYRIVWKLPA